MFYRHILHYDLGSRRVRLPNGPCRIMHLTVDGENLIYDWREVQKPKHKRNFKINDRSIFIYPLRYGAEIDVTYEVPEVMTMEQVQDMAAKFWIKTGAGPTHVVMTVEQQNALSLELNPRVRFGANGLDGNGKVSTLILAPGVVVDVLAIGPSSGKQNTLSLPKMLRIED